MSYDLKTKINTILESPHIAFWRICGKEAQRKYRNINRHTDTDREALLKEIVKLYNDCLDKMPTVKSRERKAKKDRIKRYSERGTL